MPLDLLVVVTPFVVLAVLWLPVALTLWFRRKALAAPAEARASVWFWCFRFMRYLNLGTIALWWFATDSVGLKLRAASVWHNRVPSTVPASSALFLLCFWIPPIALLIFCQVLFQPVYARIREIRWTRSELARQSAYGLGMSLIPLLLVLGGTSALTSPGNPGRPFDLVLSFALAAFSWIISGRGLRKQFQLTPNALTMGELRDRAFSLAALHRVKLRQIYLLPPGKARLANAFARSGNSILLTEILLTNLNKREVDSVIGHELSHLKQEHPRLLGFALIGGLAAVAAPYTMLSWSPGLQPFFDLLFISVPLLIFYFVARRFEYRADAGSVKLTGDPAAMITALVKLHQLNLMPLEWSKWNEKTMTHPSTVRRAHAIGRTAGISEARVNQLLASPFLNADQPADHYALPGYSSSAGKVFSTEFKRRTALRSYFGFAALAIIVPSALLRALDAFGRISGVALINTEIRQPGSSVLSFLLALVVCLAAALLFANFVPFIAYSGLCRRLRAKFAAEKIPVESGGGLLVGLSPGDSPRIFESNYTWDAGCLMLFSDRLCYWGEETCFALGRDQIVSLRMGPGIPGWFRSKFLYITWRTDEGERQITFNLRPIEVRSVIAMKRALRDLQRRIEAWRMASGSFESPPPQFELLNPPQIGEVTSTSLHDARRPRQFLSLIMFVCMISGFVASLFNLPVEWVAPIYLAEDTSAYAGISGWYAILISGLLLLFYFGPFWFSRQPREAAPAKVPPPPVPAKNSDQSPAT